MPAELYPAEDLYPSDSLYPGEGPEEEGGGSPAARIAVACEHPPDKLAWRISPPRGAPSRWAADEPLAENVIDDVRLVDEMPGGDKEGTGVLARDPRTPWPDLAPFSEVSVYGPGVEEVGCYRLDKAPESDGDRMAIEPAAVGWSRALDDNKAVVGPGFIDSALGRWGDPSAQNKIDSIKVFNRLQNGSAEVGSQGSGEAAPGIGLSWQEVVSGTDYAQAVYDGGGVDLGELRYDVDFVNGIGADWVFQAFLSDDDLFATAYDDGAVHVSTDAANQSVAASEAGRKHAKVEGYYNGGAEIQNLNALMRWLNIRVLGNHGLAPRGEGPDIGFTAKQMLAYAIPLHTSLTFDEESDGDDYIIPQAWFADPGPMSEVVQELTKYELLDWFVFGGRKLSLRKPGTYGRRWQAHAGPSGLQEQGFDGERSWDRIVGRYQDVDGSTRTVGPPGSGATVEDEALQITDPDHPAVKAREAYGETFVRQDLLDFKGVSTPSRAIEACERWLVEANELSRSGSCTLSGYVMDDRCVWRPVSQVRAGDLIRFPDAGDTGYRRVVGRDYSHSARTGSYALDAPKDGVAALLERLQAELVRLGL